MNNLLQVLASGSTSEGDIEGAINSFSIRVIFTATALLVVMLFIAARTVKKRKFKHLTKPLFIMITATIMLPSLLLIGSTIVINTVSESRGPVHWHTDLEFWVCGEEVELRDPYEFLSNKVGTASYHEHDDKRMHLEGVVVKKDYDASFEKFIAVTGGAIARTSIIIPTNENIIENDIDGDVPAGNRSILEAFKQRDGEGRPVLSIRNGDGCGGESVGETELQAFLFRFNKEDDSYTQTRLDNPARYIMRDESIVPPGDCLIVEFDTPKDRTEYLCQQYGIRDRDRCVEFGVSESSPSLCNIHETTSGGSE